MRAKNQQQLLARNTPLFLQLHIAYHVGKVFGFEHQVSLIITNILRAAFFFENVLRRFSMVTVLLCNNLAKENW
jgi:hypothetical protein